MQEVKEILKFIFRYPACFFWISFFVVPTLLISTPVSYIFLIQEFKIIPISNLLTKSATKGMLNFGLISGLISLVFNHITCHKFYSRLQKNKRNNDKASHFLNVFIKFIDASMITIDISLSLLIFVSINSHAIIHILSTLVFLISSTMFGFGMDIIMRRQNRSVPLSNSLNKILLAFEIISGLLFAFSKNSESMFSIASFFEICSFVIVFFKYIFVAMGVLGGAFLPKSIFTLEQTRNDYSINDEYLP